VTGEALRPGDPPYLGGYRIERRLGEGGQGLVYLGVSPSGEKVAIKVLRSRPLAGDASAISREIAAARQVAEFCTASILDVALDHDPPYIVSEYVEGPTLQQVIKTEGVRTGAALQRLAVATITALAAIHQAGVVHRDFKPGNVLLGPDGPRVIDFGIARILDLSTTTGTAAGSPPYMAPEHFTGGRVGPEADVFAWGSTMVFAATGKPPFGDDHLAAVAYRILHAEPELSALPDPLREVVRRCLAKEPAQRPTAHQVLLWLLNRADSASAGALEQGRAVARGAEIPAPATVPPAGRSVSRRKVVAAAGALAAALAASGAVVAYRIWEGRGTPGGQAPGGTARPLAEPAATGGGSPGVSATPVSGTGSATPRPDGTASPSASPAATTPETPSAPPGTPLELAAAIDAAIAATPCADFDFRGGFTQSDWHVTAKGRLIHGGRPEYANTQYDMVVSYPYGGPDRVIIVDRDGYAVQRRNAKFALQITEDDKQPPLYAQAAHMVFALSSMRSVIELVAATPRLQRKGRTYTGGFPIRRAGADLRLYLLHWDGAKRRPSEGYVSYTLTIDERDRPTRLRLSWQTSFDGAILASVFITRYHGWRDGEEIKPPR